MKPTAARRTAPVPGQAARPATYRPHGRITKEDIRSAGLRRWNGRSRITTDWVNLFQEPELCFPTGDILVYLREPGQSSRGPSFRVHSAHLRAHGFDYILSKCVERAPLPKSGKCLLNDCAGCDEHQPASDLYIPAPPNTDLDTVFDHHITTRNFFAWLYDLPLAGKALGVSLVALKERIDFYRPGTTAQSGVDVISFAESQCYLDFRECVDHALAALHLAEHLHVRDLWVDAFAHCVGLYHQGLRHSFEYPAISLDSRRLIQRANIHMESRMDRACRSVEAFFENDLAGNLLGLSAAGKEHFDRFRSWLHAFYIEQHGFWPPVGFEREAVQRDVYASLYTDFRNLYHHLVDLDSSTSMAETVGNGGVCVAQNIQAFDRRYRFEALPKPLPLLPLETNAQVRSLSLNRRTSWNPIAKRRLERESRTALCQQALIKASNRDWLIMDNILVRRYSEYEVDSVVDDAERISMVDGRKIRWILVYAILQILVSVMQVPTEVRNVEALSYPLCCQTPKVLPWEIQDQSQVSLTRSRTRVEPDSNILHRQASGDLKKSQLSRSPSKIDPRQTLPERFSATVNRAASTSRASSLRRLVSRRRSNASDTPPVPKSGQFCEILVRGYGNGLNEIRSEPSTPTVAFLGDQYQNVDSGTPSPRLPAVAEPECEPSQITSTEVAQQPDASSISVSREPSNASSTSDWSKESEKSETSDVSTASTEHTEVPLSIPPRAPNRPKPQPSLEEMLAATRMMHHAPAAGLDTADRPGSKNLSHVIDEHGAVQTAHINTSAWDDFLSHE